MARFNLSEQAVGIGDLLREASLGESGEFSLVRDAGAGVFVVQSGHTRLRS
jgi:hypothetical protein